LFEQPFKGVPHTWNLPKNNQDCCAMCAHPLLLMDDDPNLQHHNPRGKPVSSHQSQKLRSGGGGDLRQLFDFYTAAQFIPINVKPMTEFLPGLADVCHHFQGSVGQVGPHQHFSASWKYVEFNSDDEEGEQDKDKIIRLKTHVAHGGSDQLGRSKIYGQSKDHQRKARLYWRYHKGPNKAKCDVQHEWEELFKQQSLIHILVTY